MKYLLSSLIIWILTSCSTPIDGLWVEVNEDALLRFSDDFVINNSLQTTAFRDTLGFRLTDDSITWTGLNPDLNGGQTENSFRYKLNGDSLFIWFTPDHRTEYIRTRANNFEEYFLTIGGIELKLPKADNVRRTSNHLSPLNIRIGFKNEKASVFVERIEIGVDDLDDAIEKFKTKNSLESDIVCQLFMDEEITCDVTFWIFDRLRSHNIRHINFIAETDRYNPYTSDFWGLGIVIPPANVNIIEAKNER